MIKSILWASNAIWANTGYGIQGKHILPRLQAGGYNVNMFAWYGLRGAALEANGMRIYPAYQHPWGVDVITSHIKHSKADLLISLQDIWVLPDNYADLVHEGGAKWACWFPVDHDPIPPSVLRAAKTADYPITYSLFGQAAAADAGLDCDYIPHGVSNIYLDADMPKAEARKKLKLPDDALIVSMIAANKGMPSRKAFPENLEAFKRLLEYLPDAILYLHTEETTIRDGVNFPLLIQALEIPKENIRFVDQYQQVLGIPEQHMATIYRASDVLLASSMSEGFGIPILEAQACGTPVITTDFSSMPELTWNGCVTQPLQRHWTALNSFVAVPDVDKINGALLEIAHWTPEYRQEISEHGREKARAYAWDVLARDYWQPFLEKVARDEQSRPKHKHHWLPTGIWQENELAIPCRASKCRAELRIRRDDSRYIIPDGFSLAPNGIEMDTEDDPIGSVTKIIMREIEQSYDLDSIPFEPGDVVIDAGAHVGIVSIYLALKCPRLRIIALEPIPVNYELLCRNIVANNVENRVTAQQTALTSDGRSIILRGEGHKNSGGYSEFGNGDSFRVPSVTLADIFVEHNIETCKLLKLDVEGSEYEIILSDPEILKRVQYLRGELHKPPPTLDLTMDEFVETIRRYIKPERVKFTRTLPGILHPESYNALIDVFDGNEKYYG